MKTVQAENDWISKENLSLLEERRVLDSKLGELWVKYTAAQEDAARVSEELKQI